LRISCSPHGPASESYRLSQSIVEHLLRRDPAATLIDRALGDGAIPPIDEDYAASQRSLEDLSHDGTAAQSEALIRELERADIVVIATPVHNYTVPAALKTWIDHIARVRRTFDLSPQGKIALLHDRPVYIAVSAGGRYSGERARQPDFLTPYLKAILGMIGLNDLRFFSVEGTAFGPEAVAEARLKAGRTLDEHSAATAS
ncbi:MAG: FMN-dependent NADH-azoreductase, partial [Lysobacter sp.]